MAWGTVDARATVPSLKTMTLRSVWKGLDLLRRELPSGAVVASAWEGHTRFIHKLNLNMRQSWQGKLIVRRRIFMKYYPYLNVSQVTVLVVGLDDESVSMYLNKEVALMNVSV